MHNKVVYHAMKSFQSFGIPVLRFNFRSAGLSEGEHDHGKGEVDDLRAALDWMQQEYSVRFCSPASPSAPLLVYRLAVETTGQGHRSAGASRSAPAAVNIAIDSSPLPTAQTLYQRHER